jgi:leader peptidase (prepilin peptidase)/N-methyltransferase
MPDSILFAITALAGGPVGVALAGLSERMGNGRPTANPRRKFLLALVCTGLALWAGAVWPAPKGVMGAILAWQLVLLVVLDIEHFWLPRLLTSLLIASGLLATAAEFPDQLPGHLLGALLGFAFLAAVAIAYRFWRGQDGLGGGDAWLLAGGGAWTGWFGLPSILILAALAGLFQIAVLAWRGKPVGGMHPIPFGVGLSLGIWLVWLYGPLDQMVYSASMP